MNKEIFLLDVCSEEELNKLEQLYYMSTTKERIVSLAMTMVQTPNSVINSYYEDYLKIFIEYDKFKQQFYHNYIEPAIEKNKSQYWEIDFVKKVAYIYD